jgi:hypothetical protein
LEVGDADQVNCFVQSYTMPKRNLRVLKWLGTTPAVAVCTFCNREFKVPLEVLKRVGGAVEHLKLQFAQHQCKEVEDNASSS